MKKTLIQPLPDPFEPFALSPGIAYGDLLFISLSPGKPLSTRRDR